MSPETNAPAVEMKMQPTEFAELRAGAADIRQRDFHLGRFLESLVLHLGHAHGLDPAVEDAKAHAEALQAQREAEDARLKDEADALAAKRAAEDAAPHAQSPEEQLAFQRQAEDAQLQADAEARDKQRAEEDAAEQARLAGKPVPAPAPDVVIESAPAQEGSSYAN